MSDYLKLTAYFGERQRTGRRFVAEAMLSSQKVLPTTLTSSGYTFTDTQIEPTLERLFHD